MASISQGHPAFPPRSTYAASGKLPDRTTLNNPPPFGSSALSRRPDQHAQQYSQQPPQPPQHGQQQQMQGGGGRQHQQSQQAGQEKEPNPLNDLSEEQREEINEAVRLQIIPSCLERKVLGSHKQSNVHTLPPFTNPY
jgi:hypothetical protein